MESSEHNVACLLISLHQQLQGAKKVSFTVCHSGIKAATSMYKPKRKMFTMSRIHYSSSMIKISQKNSFTHRTS